MTQLRSTQPPSSPPVIAAIGCSGAIGAVFADGLLREGVTLRLLARDAQAAAERFPGATVVQGSLMNTADVVRAMEGADLAFVLTPMGVNDDTELEVEAAQAIIAAARSCRVPQLVYMSVLGADRPHGVAILDAKYEVERLLAASDLNWTVLRCGSYMEDVFDARVELLKRGTFLFPVTKERRLCYTSQQDVAPFVVKHILGRPDRRASVIDFVAPGSLSITAVEKLLSEAAGRKVKATPKFPVYYMFMALLPWYRLRRHRFASILPLIRYFERNGYVSTRPQVQQVVPAYQMKTLASHLRELLAP